MVRRPSAPTSASRVAGGNFSTPHDSVRLSLWDRSIVVESCRTFETADFAYALDRGARRDALQNQADDRDCGRTARQMEDIMAWRDDKARAILIRDAAGSVPAGKSPRAFAEPLFGYTNIEDLANYDAASLALLAEHAW